MHPASACLLAVKSGEPGKGSAGSRLQHDDEKAMSKAKKSATLVRTEVPLFASPPPRLPRRHVYILRVRSKSSEAEAVPGREQQSVRDGAVPLSVGGQNARGFRPCFPPQASFRRASLFPLRVASPQKGVRFEG